MVGARALRSRVAAVQPRRETGEGGAETPRLLLCTAGSRVRPGAIRRIKTIVLRRRAGVELQVDAEARTRPGGAPRRRLRRLRPSCISRCPTCAPCARRNPETTAFMELAGAGGTRERPRAPSACSGGCRTAASRANLKRAVLVAEDSGFWQHEGIEFEQMKESMEVEHRAARVRARRQHHHAAAGQEPLSVAVEESDPEDPRDPDRAPARSGADQAADPRALSQSDRVGRRRLRRGGGGANLLRQVGRRSRPSGSGAARRRDHQPARAQSGTSNGAAAAPPADDPAADGRRDAASGRGRGSRRQARDILACRCPMPRLRRRPCRNLARRRRCRERASRRRPSLQPVRASAALRLSD